MPVQAALEAQRDLDPGPGQPVFEMPALSLGGLLFTPEQRRRGGALRETGLEPVRAALLWTETIEIMEISSAALDAELAAIIAA